MRGGRYLMEVVRSFVAKIRKWLGLDKKQAETPASNSYSTGA
jgi:hypothetical protein